MGENILDRIIDLIVTGWQDEQIINGLIEYNLPEFRIGEMIVQAKEKLRSGEGLEVESSYEKTMLRYNFSYEQMIKQTNYKGANGIKEKINALKDTVPREVFIFKKVKETIFKGIRPAANATESNLYLTTEEIRQKAAQITGIFDLSVSEVSDWLTSEHYIFMRTSGLDGVWLLIEEQPSVLSLD